MKKLSDIHQSATHRILIYGPPKSGKTELAGRLAEKYKIIWFDLEQGYQTLLKLPIEQQENISLISLPNTRVWPIAIETMLKVLAFRQVKICDQHGKVSCPVCLKSGGDFSEVDLSSLDKETVVVIDSLTELANSAIAHVTRNMDDEYKYEWDDYRKQGTLMEKILSSIQQARCNIICITHEIEAEMEDGKLKVFPVSGTRNFSRTTAKYFDHVIYMDVRNGAHRAGSETTYINNIVTGSRLDFNVSKNSLLQLLDGSFIKAEPGRAEGTTQLKKLSSLLKK